MNHAIRMVAVVLLTALSASALAQPVRTMYVDDSAPPGGTGNSWNTAYQSLQTALNVSVGAGSQILVGQGTYTPAGPGGARSTSFVLRFVFASIRGGYAGYGAANPDERSPALYPTILSGDLNGDDGPDFANNAENSLHVVRATNVTGATTLEGFVITAGNADTLGGTDFAGGGMRTDTSALVVRDCVFEGNSSYRAGAHYAAVTMTSGAPQFLRCAFRNNRSTTSYAGAVYTESTSGRPAQTFANCEFTGNAAGQYGGAFVLNGLDLLLLNCRVTDNTSLDGVAGAGETLNCTSRVINCTIANNLANLPFPGLAGGLIFGDVSAPSVVGCIVYGNAGVQIAGSPTAVVSYSDVQGGYAGTGNFDADPLFVSGTDYRLGAGSSCVDAGNTLAFLNAAAALGIAGDLSGQGRYIDDPDALDTGVGGPPVIDMGCYERLPGAPPDPCPIDTNADGVIDFFDLNNILSLYGGACR